MCDFNSDSALIAELETAGFDIQSLQEKKQEEKQKSLIECWREVINNSSKKFRFLPLKAEEVDSIDINLFIPFQLIFLFLFSIGVLLVGKGDFFAAGLYFVMMATSARSLHLDTHIRGLFRWLTDWKGPEPLTDKEVVDLLSQQLKEQKEKVLGITLADEKESLEKVKRELQDHRQELLSQRKGNKRHGLEDEIDAYVSAIDEKVAEIDEALERINEFLADVRQLASDIAAEILPVYRRQKEVLEVFDAVPETIEIADEHLESAEKKLEKSRLALERKLKALNDSIQKANHFSAELGKLKTADALHAGQLTGVLEVSEAGVAEKSNQETADCKRA